MQIILKEDVKDLGRSGEMVTVAEGFARNYLLPRKLAVQATPGMMKDMRKRMDAAKQRDARETDEAQKVAETLKDARLTISGRAAEGSTRQHGSITPADLSYRDIDRYIFEAISDLARRDEPADLLTVAEELQRQGRLELIGGRPYLGALQESVPTAAHCEYYAKIVAEKAVLRRLIDAS